VDFKTRLVPGVLIGGVVLAGGGSVIAASGGSSSTQSASSTQYCPDGTPKPPNGDCSGHGGKPGGPPEHKPPHHKKHKKPKFHVHRNPHRSCYSGNIGFRIGVANLPKRHKTRVYRDGRFVTMSGKKAFKVHFNAARLRRGMHTLTLRLRGSDGKWYTSTTHFRRC
jgi:hypothetical protein